MTRSVFDWICWLFTTAPTLLRVKLLGPRKVHTVRGGNWNDPSIWSNCRLPRKGDRVTLNHRVWVADGDQIADLLTVIITFPDGGLSFIYDGKMDVEKLILEGPSQDLDILPGGEHTREAG